MSLKKKTIIATKWSASFAVAQQVFGIVITVILARLLTPEDFGLMAIVGTMIGIVRMFQDIGLGPALVQRKDLNEEHINTVFWSMLVFGILLFLFFCITAPLVGKFYNDLRLIPLIIVCSVGFILGPFFMVHQRLLERRMDFRHLGIVAISVNILTGFIAVYLALAGWGVWSLVFHSILFYVFTPLIIWRYVEWRPRFQFHWQRCKELLGFGFNLSASKTVGYLRLNIPFLIIGRVLGAFPLGIYRLGNRVVSQPLLNVSAVFSRALFSSYSKVQDDNTRLSKGYLMTLHYMGLAIVPIVAGIMTSAPEIVHVVFGEKWAGAIPIIQVVCIIGIIEIFVNTGASVCYAKGRPDIFLKWNMLALGICIPVIILAAKVGIIVVAVSLAVVSIPLFIIVQSLINRLIRLSWSGFLHNLQQPFLISIIMAFLVFIARFKLIQLSLSRPQILIGEVLIGLLCYILLNLILNRDSMVQAWKMLITRDE